MFSAEGVQISAENKVYRIHPTGLMVYYLQPENSKVLLDFVHQVLLLLTDSKIR